jgi:hypothetical protein
MVLVGKLASVFKNHIKTIQKTSHAKLGNMDYSAYRYYFQRYYEAAQ